MQRAVVNAAIGRNDNLARLAKSEAGAGASAGAALTVLAAIFANSVEALATTQSTQATVSVTAPTITSLSGGVFRVAASATAVTTVASTIVQFQLLRDSTPVGPLISVTSDATNKLATAAIEWLDKTGSLTAHVYSLKMTPAASTISIGSGQGSIVVEDAPL